MAVKNYSKNNHTSILERLDYLANRWEDEKQYEDWMTYVANMRKKCKENGLVMLTFDTTTFRVTAREIEGEKKVFEYLLKGNEMMYNLVPDLSLN